MLFGKGNGVMVVSSRSDEEKMYGEVSQRGGPIAVSRALRLFCLAYDVLAIGPARSL